MTIRRRFAPQAVRDTEDAAEWFAEGPGGVQLARRFLAAVGIPPSPESDEPL